MFDNFSVNVRENEGFLTYISCIPIPEYGQSNAPLQTPNLVPRSLTVIRAFKRKEKEGRWGGGCVY